MYVQGFSANKSGWQMQAIDSRVVQDLLYVMQSGIYVPCAQTVSVEGFLLHNLGLDAVLLATQVQTVMLNSRVVDRMHEAMLVPGSRLALSAAMPGLVGATLRSGGLLANLRSGITFTAAGGAAAPSAEPFVFELHLYNSLIPLLAPLLCAYGFFALKSKIGPVAQTLLREIPESWKPLCLGPGYAWLQRV